MTKKSVQAFARTDLATTRITIMASFALPKNFLQFKGNPQGLTVTRVSSRNKHSIPATGKQTLAFRSTRLFLAEEHVGLSEHWNEVIV